MTGEGPDIVVLREGTEGLSMAAYRDELVDRLPDHDIRLAATPAQERALVEDARIATGVRIDESLLDLASNLELFACVFAGTDHLPLSALADRGVAVTNAGGIHVPGIAEHAIGFVLVFARRLDEGWRRQRRREWRHFQSFELADSTVTIVGLGAIGRAIARRIGGFDVRTVGVRYTPEKGGPTDEVIGYDRDAFHEALSRTDYLVVACPLTDTTRGLIDDDALSTLPPHAVLVNMARGPVVDTGALVDAIRSNRLRGAGLDVTDPEPLPEDHPLWGFENVHITPHTGGHNPNHWDRMADILAANVDHLERGGGADGLKNRVLRPARGGP